MLKQAFEAGEKSAYDLFKVALAMPNPSMAVRATNWAQSLKPKINDFVQGQMGHLGDAGRGIMGMFSKDPAAHMAGRTQAWEGLKGALPTLGALGAGAYLMSGPSDEERRQRALQQQMMMMRGY